MILIDKKRDNSMGLLNSSHFFIEQNYVYLYNTNNTNESSTLDDDR